MRIDQVRYSGEYTAELLEEVQQLIVAGLESNHRYQLLLIQIYAWTMKGYFAS